MKKQVKVVAVVMAIICLLMTIPSNLYAEQIPEKPTGPMYEKPTGPQPDNEDGTMPAEDVLGQQNGGPLSEEAKNIPTDTNELEEVTETNSTKNNVVIIVVAVVAVVAIVMIKKNKNKEDKK